MSGARQRRDRILERERRNIGRHGKKSSMELRRADHGEALEEQSAKTLEALLRARATGGTIIVAPTVNNLSPPPHYP